MLSQSSSQRAFQRKSTVMVARVTNNIDEDEQVEFDSLGAIKVREGVQSVG